MTELKLAKATSNLLDLTAGDLQSVQPSYKEPDQLNVPDKWDKRVNKIRFFYHRDPIAATVVNKIVDITVNGIYNHQGDLSDEIFEVYESFKDALEDALRNMAREYALSGLVIPEITWYSQEFRTKDPDSILDFEAGGAYTVPQTIWIRDPATIEAVKTPIPNRILYYIKISEELRYFIQNNGVYLDGTRDSITYELLVRQYPDFVAAVRRGDEKYLIEPFMVIRRAPLAGEAYPTPYLLPVLEALSYKRKLRKMDYSIAARVISAIQIVKMGNDLYPLTEADSNQLVELKNEMLWRGREDNIERVFQLVSNHTLEIEWVYPDTRALLDSGKYKAVDQDIMFGLGFPRILLTGETERSFTSDAEFAMFSPSETIESIRKDLMKFVRRLYQRVAELNGFEGYPELSFAPLRLYDLKKMSEVSKDLYEKGMLSRTSYLELGDRSFLDEVHNLKREKAILKEFGLPDFPAQPFTPQPQQPNENNNSEGGEEDA